MKLAIEIKGDKVLTCIDLHERCNSYTTRLLNKNDIEVFSKALTLLAGTLIDDDELAYLEDYKAKKKTIDNEEVTDSEACKTKEPLTFERIKKECIPLQTLFVSPASGQKRLYLGFNRKGNLITDNFSGCSAIVWREEDIGDWGQE